VPVEAVRAAIFYVFKIYRDRAFPVLNVSIPELKLRKGVFCPDTFTAYSVIALICSLSL